jgi:hypothetical protein
MPVIALSDAAVALLRLQLERDERIAVDGSNRLLCRELAAEGLLTVGHSFTLGREAFYVPTRLGRNLGEVLARFPSAPSPSESASPHS